jgi:hypothetical protein
MCPQPVQRQKSSYTSATFNGTRFNTAAFSTFWIGALQSVQRVHGKAFFGPASREDGAEALQGDFPELRGRHLGRVLGVVAEQARHARQSP